MANKSILKARGLYTDPNLLSEVPEGAQVVADNIIIDRNSVIEPRRGMAKYGNTFGADSNEIAKQLLVYKNRILVHYEDKLLYNSVAHTTANNGNFLQFSGTYSETEAGLRIKSVESNRNLYFTTSQGIKKISARTAADFTTGAGFISDAGAYKALDVTGSLNFDTEGFLPGQSKVAYRVVWGYRDSNDNLILGSPSSRLVIVNYSNATANVDLSFTIPENLTDDYFYQVYRTGIFTVSGNLTLDDLDPGDEMNLVIEDYPDVGELSALTVTVTDLSPEDFRQNGLPLYTNPNSGEGIGQANEPPPKAKDVTMYQNTVFYANTERRANKTISLLGIEDFVSSTSTFIITSTLGTQTYTFVGAKETTRANFTSYSGTIPTDTNGNYWLINSASNARKYYVWYDNTKTTQKIDFTNYIGTIPADLDTRYVVLYHNGEAKYYLWYDATGTSIDPGLNPANTDLLGLLSIRVDVSTGVTTKADIATETDAALTASNIYNDYDVVFTPTNTYVEIETASFPADVDYLENIQKGFAFTLTTPVNADPASTPLTNTDVVGRTPIRVNVSRGVTTKAQLADATAAAFLEQDSALDFSVAYTASNQYLDITNTNNGNTTDAVDSAIEGLGSGFAVTVTAQGDGEDAALKHVLLSAAATPSQQIDETARSLVNIINKNASEVVNAFYISGPSDLPGQILLETRDISVNSFSITANNAATGASFNPKLPPATDATPVEGIPETKPNRIYFAKLQQPEAVPLLNFIDIGPEDQEISRILALRESLFILKTDGVYRLTGSNGSYAVDLFDGTTKLIAPDSAVILNNQIFCLTNQGVAFISDTGVEIISKELDNVFQQITSSEYNYRYTTFGVSYETDRAYILNLPTTTIDDVATQAYRYNSATRTWTRLDFSKTCGIVNPADDKLYMGASDDGFIERERKNFNRTDYADRQFDLSIPIDSVDGVDVTLSQANIADIGDALVQTQYLTIRQFNQLLKKLDLDPYIDSDYFSTLEAIPGDNMSLKLTELATKLDADPVIAQNDFLAAIGIYDATNSAVDDSNPAVITETNHGLQTGRVIRVTNSDTTPNIDGTWTITRLDANTFSIPVTTTVSGNCDWEADLVSFDEFQGAFNTIVNKINVDTGILHSNYPLSEGTFEIEALITDVQNATANVEIEYSLFFIQGAITLFKGIPVEILYVPETFGDPSLVKQVSEGMFMFENNTFSRGEIGYKTDLSPNITLIPFERSGKGDWGLFAWSNQNWGGGFSGVPLRTYIPLPKQKCTYIQAYFNHSSAREKWSIFGISYVYKPISNRPYRG